MNCRPAVTTACGFHPIDRNGGTMFTVAEGVPATDALEQASSLLACIESLSLSVATATVNGGEAFAVFYLAEMAKAMIDASGDSLRMEGGQ